MNKYCTSCGRVLLDHRSGLAATELFDSELLSKSGILRLRECAHCGLADRYVESDGTLVLIDLVLGAKAAYRHVLLNGGKDYARLIGKMALLAIICDGYIGYKTASSHAPNSNTEFFEQEFQFYGFCGRTFMGLAAFTLITLPSMALGTRCGDTRSVFPGLLGLLMAYGSRFLNLSALFWAGSDSDEMKGGESLMWGFIYLLFFVATVRAMQVTQRRSLPCSLLLSCLAHAGFLATTHYDVIINPMVCLQE